MNEIGGPLLPQGMAEVFITWADDPPNGRRLRIAPAGRRVLITVTLLALVEAGESPWAWLTDLGRVFSEGDPFGYQGSLLRVDATGRTAAYRVGGYLPPQRGYLAELQEEPPRPAIMGG